MLTQLIDDCQDEEGPEVQQMLKKWMDERDELRYELHFGFRDEFLIIFFQPTNKNGLQPPIWKRFPHLPEPKLFFKTTF
jgi:hypothetical protein